MFLKNNKRGWEGGWLFGTLEQKKKIVDLFAQYMVIWFDHFTCIPSVIFNANLELTESIKEKQFSLHLLAQFLKALRYFLYDHFCQ